MPGSGWLSKYDRYSASAAIERGKKAVGKVSYSWGGKTYPNLDCSGFVCYCYGLPGGGTGGLDSNCTSHGFKRAKPPMKLGDVVFWIAGESGQEYGHAGIFLKPGQVLQSSSGVGAHIGKQHAAFSNHIMRPPEGTEEVPIQWTASK